MTIMRIRSVPIAIVLIFAWLSFTAAYLHAAPLPAIDQFVLGTQAGIHLAQSVQLSNGVTVSNGVIAIAEQDIINGDLYGNEIDVASSSTINGNLSFNTLKAAASSVIYGSKSSPISLPIFNLPQISAFRVGTQNLTIKSDQTLSPGNYASVVVMPGVTLRIAPGVYGLTALQLRDYSKLLFSGPTVINIRNALTFNQSVLVAQSAKILSTDLDIEYSGTSPVTVGTGCLLSMRLLSPASTVQLGMQVALRGQLLASSVNIGEQSTLSRSDNFSTKSDPSKVVVFQGQTLIADELLVIFKDGATLLDAYQVANLVGGRIAGSLDRPFVVKIQVPTNAAGLIADINLIQNSANPLIIDVLPNAVAQ